VVSKSKRRCTLFEIYCLMVGGANLTDQMRDLLFYSSREMFREGRHNAHVVTDDLEARIETAFKTAVLGYIAGPVFSAEVDSIRGKATVHYIIRDRDLDSIDPDDSPWMRVVGLGDPRWN